MPSTSTPTVTVSTPFASTAGGGVAYYAPDKYKAMYDTAGGEEKTFTQAELNAIVAERLGRERAEAAFLFCI